MDGHLLTQTSRKVLSLGISEKLLIHINGEK